MAYNTSNEWKTKVEGDDKSYVPYLLLNNYYVPAEQISRIDFIEDIIDSESETMYLGTFRSNQIDITFKNLNNLDIQSNIPVYFELGLNTGYKELEATFVEVSSGLKRFQLVDDDEYQYLGIKKYIDIMIDNVLYTRKIIENGSFNDENDYFDINLYEIDYIYNETTDTTYQSDKEYYSYENNQYTLLVADTDYTVGDTIEGTVYEKEFPITEESVITVYPYEYVPKGYYLIEEPDENYYSTCKITCLDYAVKLKTNCDYSSALDYIYYQTSDETYQSNKTYYSLVSNEYVELVADTDYTVGDEITGVIYEKTENKAITIENLLKWICLQYGVSLGTYPNTNKDVLISVYDSTLSGKKYISYIAEIMGGNAKFNRNNELCIIPIKNTSIGTKNALKRETFKVNEQYKITKVYYTDGSRVFEYGNDNNNTLQIRQENMFIVDTNIISNIYNSVNGLNVYGLETKAPADLSLDCWDIIDFETDYDSDNDEYITYSTFNNHKTTYSTSLIGTILTKIPTKQQEKTTNVVENTDADNIRRIQTEINQLDGTFKVLAEDITATKSDINNNYYNKGTIDTMITDSTNGIVNTFTTIGGDNVFRNTGLWFKKDNSIKRKVQIGDNLTNKTIYFNIPNDIDTSLFNQHNPVISFNNVNIYISSFYNSEHDGMITFEDEQNFKSFDIFFKVNGEENPITNISYKNLKEFYQSYNLNCPDLIVTNVDSFFQNYIEVLETEISNTYWEYWYGNANRIEEIKSTNKYAILLKNGTFSQNQDVIVNNYTISFVYKKLIPLANVTMEINNKEYILDEEEFTVFSETSYFDSGQITIEFISDTDNSCEIYDLMVNVGENSLPYNQNQNEITTSTVQISEGITISNTNEDTVFKADADGIRVKDKNTNNNITYFTNVGMETKQAVITEQSEIVGLLFQRVNGQTWISWLGDE